MQVEWRGPSAEIVEKEEGQARTHCRELVEPATRDAKTMFPCLPLQAAKVVVGDAKSASAEEGA